MFGVLRTNIQDLRSLKRVHICKRTFLKYASLASKKYADDGAYCGSRTGHFTQVKPQLGNQYFDDPLLRRCLERHLPRDVFEDIQDDLTSFGDLVSGEVLNYHNDVCNNEPILQQYNAWGERVDKIIMHPSWRALHNVAAKEGLISIPYVNKYSEWSRLYQIAKLYLFSPSSGLYSCPLAMTDGAASILKFHDKEPFSLAFEKLTSNDPNIFWTSGQWMTEKQGGSDVGNGTETIAVPQENGTFKLYGYKWFTSATDADMSLTLARNVDQDGNITEGTNGLSMFYVQTRNEDGKLNGIHIEKLKKKLGTRQMPTAELILDGTTAYQVSESGRGISSISPMLTVTRIHNSVSAVASMRRLLNLSKDYAGKREVFGKMLCDHSLHNQTLIRLEMEQRGGFHLLMKVGSLLGLVENNVATDKDELLLRILTPLIKLYTGKQAVSVASEGLESFGGFGYLEDTGLPVYLRDAQVLSIWEGTTNVLSLDMLRAIQKTSGETLKSFLEDAFSMLTVGEITDQQMSDTHRTLQVALQGLVKFSEKHFGSQDFLYLTAAARDFSYSLARVYIGCLLFDDSVNRHDHISSTIAYRWCCGQDLTPVLTGDNLNLYNASTLEQDAEILYGLHSSCEKTNFSH